MVYNIFVTFTNCEAKRNGKDCVELEMRTVRYGGFTTSSIVMNNNQLDMIRLAIERFQQGEAHDAAEQRRHVDTGEPLRRGEYDGAEDVRIQ